MKIKIYRFSFSFICIIEITEPAIYGINRFFRPFVCGMIGGAAGGFIASLLNLAATGMAVTVIPGLLLFLNNQIFGYIIAIAAAIIVSFAATWFFGYRDEMLKGDEIGMKLKKEFLYLYDKRGKRRAGRTAEKGFKLSLETKLSYPASIRSPK